jgi:hypothetical protein
MAMSMPDRPDPTTQAMLRLIPGVGAVMAQWRDETYLRDKERVERMGAATAEVIDGEAVLRAIQEDERVSDMFRDVVSAAVRTGDDNKLGLLGRALASGALAKGDAAVDEAQQFLRIASELDPVEVEHLLGVFTAARLRLGVSGARCDNCSSYRVVAGICEHCGWRDPHYMPLATKPLSAKERARRLAQPCSLTSDISTFTRPEDFH